jgi:hypothetical protein
MLSQIKAKLAAVHTAGGTPLRHSLAVLALSGLAALGGCLPPAPPLAGADPADPNAKTAPVGYRSTIGPYTAARPTAPSSWREQNDRVAPKPEQRQ